MTQTTKNALEDLEIFFEKWRNWERRRDPPVDPTCGGVYLLAYCSTGKPPEVSSIDSLPVEVIYVGDAKDLNKRPLTGRHHRIERYRELFGSNMERLFVACAPLYETLCDDSHLKRAFSFYAEAMLVWKYTKLHGHPPAMHYKDKGEPPRWVSPVVSKLKSKVSRLERNQ